MGKPRVLAETSYWPGLWRGAAGICSCVGLVPRVFVKFSTFAGMLVPSGLHAGKHTRPGIWLCVHPLPAEREPGNCCCLPRLGEGKTLPGYLLHIGLLLEQISNHAAQIRAAGGQQSPYYEQLSAAAQTAEAEGLGVWSKASILHHIILRF